VVRFAHIATKAKNCYGQLNKALVFAVIIASQWMIITQPPIENSIAHKQKRIEFIKTTQDIKKLREASLILVESDHAYTKHLNELFTSIRNISLIVSALPALLVFYTFRLNKQFLTTRPEVDHN